jgi:hypothetical protein
MSEIKKSKTTNIIDLEKIFKIFFHGEKSKYINLFVNLSKKSINTEFIEGSEKFKEIKYYLTKNHFLSIEQIDEFSNVDLYLIWGIIESPHILGFSKSKLYNSFISLNERGLVKNNDLSTYDSFEKIQSAVSVGELKLIEKEMEKEVIKIHSDGEWLILRPLTTLSSEKYGYGTKWCTTMSTDYFLNYSKDSILIYIINRINGLKTAFHYSLKDKSISFWNAEDQRIDSMQANLPGFIFDIIQSEMKIGKDNFSFLSKEKQDLELKQVNELKRTPIQEGQAPGYDDERAMDEEDLVDDIFIPEDMVNPMDMQRLMDETGDVPIRRFMNGGHQINEAQSL